MSTAGPGLAPRSVIAWPWAPGAVAVGETLPDRLVRWASGGITRAISCITCAQSKRLRAIDVTVSARFLRRSENAEYEARLLACASADVACCSSEASVSLRWLTVL